VLFFHPEYPYRIAHPHVGGDECTIFTLSPKLAERRPSPFLAGHGPCSPRLARLHFEVLTQAAEPALAGEDALAALLDEALGVPLPARSAPARHRDLTEGAKAALHARITAAPHLAELACSLGVSPFHLSRTFARVEGIPLRRPDGTPIRWIFTDIRVDSCTWRGEASSDGGKTWHLEAEFRLRRITR
jgi:hypothetical protein